MLKPSKQHIQAWTALYNTYMRRQQEVLPLQYKLFLLLPNNKGIDNGAIIA